MNQLITLALKFERPDLLIKFPGVLMNDFEQEVVTWVLDYIRIYSKPPTIARLQKKFHHFLEIEDDGVPADDIFEQTLNAKRKEVALASLSDIEMAIRDTEDIPIELLDTLLRKMALTSSGLELYSTFDRDAYFRTGESFKLGLSLQDKAIGGIKNGDYMLITGRLATGKSTLALWFTQNWWASGKRILFVSNEMMFADVFARLDGMVGKFNPLFLRGDADAIPIEIRKTLKVVAHIASTASGEIIIPAMRLMKPSAVIGIAKYLNIDLIVIDGIHLMEPDSFQASRWERVASVSNALKQGALEIGRPITAVTQLKRTGIKDVYDPEDIAYSDALGQDADFILAIHPSTTEANNAECQLIKNRFGPLVTTQVEFDFDKMTVTDITHRMGIEEVWVRK